MKKFFYAAVLMVAGFSFTSCDPDEMFDIVDEISGSVSLTITCPGVENTYTDGQIITFTSCVADAFMDSINQLHNVCLAANVSLADADLTIGAPYMGFQVNDSVAGTYQIENIITKENIINFTPVEFIDNKTGSNTFALVSTDTTCYIAKSGSINITAYNGYGQLVEGRLDNVVAYYITLSKVEYLANLYDAATSGDASAIATLATINLDTYFDQVTFNGNFSSRRMAVSRLLESLKAANAE